MLPILEAGEENSPPNPFTQLPFEEWVKQGDSEALRWKTSAFVIGLSSHQRLVARFVMQVDGNALRKRGNKGSIVGLVQITDSAGKKYRHYASMDLGDLNPEKKTSGIMDYWDAFILPGDYTVDLALYHSGTGEHNFIQRKLTVPPLKNDPLADLWRDLPALEFVDPAKPPDKETFFHPEVQGKLNLPLATRTPVELEVLVDLTPSELFHGSQTRYNHYLMSAVPAFKAFGQIAVQSGSLDMVILDLLERQVAFEQDNVKALDWPALKKALGTMGVATINVRTLEVRQHTPVFLRDEVERLTAKQAATSGNRPFQVLIIFSSPLGIYSFKGLGTTQLPRDCNCRIFYMEYDSYSVYYQEFSATGSVEKMLNPLPVKSFHVHSPEDVRTALAKILNEISQR
jgi:hypothetical protein